MIDVSAAWETKTALLRAHESQLKDFDRVEEWIRQWSGELGKRIGVEAADGFHVIVIDEDEVEVEDVPEPMEAAEEGAAPQG